MTNINSKPKVLVSIPPKLRQEIFSPQTTAALNSLAHVVCNEEERVWTSADLAGKIPGVDAVITGWQADAEFNDEVLRAADKLKVIAHSAGTVKYFVPEAVYTRGIKVSSAAVSIAPGVADMNLMMAMVLLRYGHKHDRILKENGDWEAARVPLLGEEISSQIVGIIGFGKIGQCLAKMLLGLGADVWVNDPHVSKEQIEALGAKRVEFDDLLKECRVINLCAPNLSELKHMIGAREFSLMQDGAVFINTSRSWLVDMDALLAELQSERIRAGIDVFEPLQPLPLDSPFLKLGDNVLLSPKMAGHTVQGRHRMGQIATEELIRFFSEKPLNYEVTFDMYEKIA